MATCKLVAQRPGQRLGLGLACGLFVLLAAESRTLVSAYQTAWQESPGMQPQDTINQTVPFLLPTAAGPHGPHTSARAGMHIRAHMDAHTEV